MHSSFKLIIFFQRPSWNSQFQGSCALRKGKPLRFHCLPGYAISCKVQPCGRAQCLGQGQEDVVTSNTWKGEGVGWNMFLVQKGNHLCHFTKNPTKRQKILEQVNGSWPVQRLARTSQRQPWQSPVVPIGDRLREVSLHCLSRHSHLEYSPCYRYLLYTCTRIWWCFAFTCKSWGFLFLICLRPESNSPLQNLLKV